MTSSYVRCVLMTLAGLASVAALAAQETPTTSPAAATGPTLRLDEKWIFLPLGLNDDAGVDKAIDLATRAAKAGYNTVDISDKVMTMLEDKVPDFKARAARLEKIVKACRALKLRIIVPACAGYLMADPNLIEGMPVVDAPFIVKNGLLTPFDDGSLVLVNGSFEKAGPKGVPDGWGIRSGEKLWTLDKEVTFEGKPAIRMADLGANGGKCVIGQLIKVKPSRYYHMTVQVKTEGFEDPKSLMLGVAGKTGVKGDLNVQNFEIEKTMDWKKIDVIFDTFDNTQIELHLGAWGAGKGKVWFADVQVEPGGFVNLIRRDGAPLKMTSEDGSVVMEEGKDFNRAVDPKMGHSNNWGNYHYWTQHPKVGIPAGSRLKEGQKVLLSYSHVVLVKDYGTFYCLNEPKRFDIARKQVAGIHKWLNPDGYFLGHDEIRFGGWDDACVKSGRTPAQSLADDIRQCYDIIHKEDPAKPVYVWSDMFDPNHNAHKSGHYYLVKGEAPWYGSWEGLDKNIIVVNWAGPHIESLKWFASLGNRQILAGYYDHGPADDIKWLKMAADFDVVGVVYTTWENNYTQLEKWLSTMELTVKQIKSGATDPKADKTTPPTPHATRG